MSMPEGLVAWTSLQKARKAAKAATGRTGIRHRAAKSSYLDIDWDATSITWTEVPCYVLVLEPRRAQP
jgi:hypothetical protein